jgi:hypothetical protein
MTGYTPTEMHLGPLTRLGGRAFKANIAFDDHPGALRFSDRINAVTVDSMLAFLRGRDEGWRAGDQGPPLTRGQVHQFYTASAFVGAVQCGLTTSNCGLIGKRLISA